METLTLAENIKKMYRGVPSKFEFITSDEAQDAVISCSSLIHSQRKEELFRLLYYFLTKASKEFIDSWLYQFMLGMAPFQTDIEPLQKSDEHFFADLTPDEVMIIYNAILFFYDQYPTCLDDKKYNKYLFSFWDRFVTQKKIQRIMTKN